MKKNYFKKMNLKEKTKERECERERKSQDRKQAIQNSTKPMNLLGDGGERSAVSKYVGDVQGSRIYA
jgi:hypothetical protein